MKKSVIKKAVMVVLLIEILSVGIGIMDYFSAKGFDGSLDRPKQGENRKIYELEAQTSLGNKEIEVTVSPIELSEKEAKGLIDEAIKEIDNTFLSDNESLEGVSKDVYISTKYVGGRVSASWRFDNYKLMASDGKIRRENIEEDTVITAYCDMEAGNESYTYTFAFVVTLPDPTTEEGFSYYLDEKLKDIDVSSPKSSSISLPGQIGETKINWSRPKTFRSIQIGILGILAGGLMLLSEKEKEKNEIKERNNCLTRDYPDIVSNLSLYVGAGINIKNALLKIGENYSKQKLNNNIKTRIGFEEIVVTGNEMKDGKGELEALRQFGKRVGHKDYRKLSLILIQNLRKGNGQIVELLEKEEKWAFDDRKTRARIAGEEASTKLLLPMFGLLSIVLIMLIFPALSGYKI